MSADPAPRADTCPRCGKAFHCGVADAAACPCVDLTLSPELTAALRAQFDGCLCLACLACLARLAELQAQPVAGQPS